MIKQESLEFQAHLLKHSEKIPIDAKYASKYSLLIRFPNRNGTAEGSEFSKIVFQSSGKTIEIGPCQYITEPKSNGYQGR